jgi:hypothetical protein
MLKIALSHFPEKKATKNDIFTKVSEMFFRASLGSEKSDDTWKKSASQIIASCLSFTKQKGYYSLTEKALNMALSTRDIRTFSFKMKLIYVLKNLSGNKGNIRQITDKYIQTFKDIDKTDFTDTNKRKTLKNSILKTLNQNSEFDTNNSKTVYGLSQSAELSCN